MRVLEQKKSYNKRCYTLSDNSDFIKVYSKDANKIWEYKVHLNDIGSKIEYLKGNTLGLSIILVIFICMSIFSAVMYYVDPIEYQGGLGTAILFLILGILLMTIPTKDELYITGGKTNISFMRKAPNEKEVLDFVHEIIKRSAKTKKKFLINFDLTENHFNENLLWLLKAEIIDKTDAELIKTKYINHRREY